MDQCSRTSDWLFVIRINATIFKTTLDKKEKREIMKHLYIVRHGLTELNKANVFAGVTETPLTKEGRGQAKDAGKHIAGLNIDLIVSSPLGRAIETAQIIAKEIGYPKDKIAINYYFAERNFGRFEGTTYSPDLNLDGFSDVESFDELLERAHLGMRWINKQAAENILIVSHGSFTRAIRELHLPHIDRSVKVANAEVVQLI